MIRFDNKNKTICIRTLNTEYRMQIVHENYLVHLYYGKKQKAKKSCYLEETVDFAPYVAKIGANFSLNTVLSELSFFDRGDLKDTAIKIKNENGDCVTLFLYRSHRIFPGREELPGMPYSRGACETLEIVYYDEVSGCELYSYYTVFEKSDTIVRYAKFKSCKSTVCLERALIGQLDLPNGDYSRVTLCGDYGAERHIEEGPVRIGLQGIYSKRGHSSHQFNPFLILKEKGTTENSGNAYAFEFVYSGDFEANVEKTFSGRYRIMMGLNRDTFSWLLKKGESFTTPETIMTYSANGLNRLSQNLHDHLREHIIPPKFAYSERPIVINTWEGVHFFFFLDVLLKYAEKAKKLGLDTLVIDDGWFGNRCNDAEGLGDWYVNHEKFRNGLAAFSEKIHKMGLKLGIWIEPEMISPHSELFRQHPDWVLCSKGRAPSLGRKQLVLDLTRDDVVI